MLHPEAQTQSSSETHICRCGRCWSTSQSTHSPSTLLQLPAFPSSSFWSHGPGCASSPFLSPSNVLVPSVVLFRAHFYPRSQLFPPSVNMLNPHFSPLIHCQSAPVPSSLEKLVFLFPFPSRYSFVLERVAWLSRALRGALSLTQTVPNPPPTCLF